MEPTSVTQLDQLRQAPDPEIWCRFIHLYTPLLFGWARTATRNDADAADLVQDVLTIVIQRLPGFQARASGSFRGWLRTILLNRWRAQLRRPRPTSLDQVALLPEPGDPSLPDEIEDQRQLLHQALVLLQPEFQPATWEAFQQTALLGRPASAVAAELGLSTNAVYVARSRVLQRLRLEVAGLLDPG